MIRLTNSLAAKLFEIEYTVFFTAIYVDYVDRILAIHVPMRCSTDT